MLAELYHKVPLSVHTNVRIIRQEGASTQNCNYLNTFQDNVLASSVTPTAVREGLSNSEIILSDDFELEGQGSISTSDKQFFFFLFVATSIAALRYILLCAQRIRGGGGFSPIARISLVSSIQYQD